MFSRRLYRRVKVTPLAWLTLGLLLLGNGAEAATPWSEQDYYLYPGDFNADGRTDLLYLARDGSKLSGIAVSSTSGQPDTHLQSWQSNYLGIPWSDGAYTALVADFSGDGRADVFMQRNSPGDSYLLHANAEGKLVGIQQTVASIHLGLGWTADQHKLVAGDFNGDSRADLFLQATLRGGLHAVVTAGTGGQFTAGPTQTWNDGYLGLNWSAPTAFVFAGKFNGDNRADLLVQGRPNAILIDFDIPIPLTTYPAAMNGVAFSQSSGSLFQLAGVQTWGRMANGVDWSPLTHTVVVGDFNGDGRDDAILQRRVSIGSSSILHSNASGAVFPASPTTLTSNVASDGTSTRLIAGNFDGTGGAGLYYQALVPSGTNHIANTLSSGSFTASPQNTYPTAPAASLTANTVGHTVGSFAVSDTGAATYSIPIVVPPGIAGVQPQLSIEYQSGAGNGLLGIGWNLGGLSTIERCKKTLVQDSSNDRISLTTSDVFCIDGNRLRRTGGTAYGLSGSVYQTEIETFGRITAYDTAGNGPAYFILEAKSGLIYEYGNSADSRIESTAPGFTTTARSWALNKVRDRAGNTMTISYLEDGAPNGSYRPNEIVYTTNVSAGVSSGPSKVKLFWDDRPPSDLLSGYYVGGVVRETKRLNRLETHHNSGSGFVLVRRYQLAYNSSGTGGQSRLASVQECDSGGNCLAATTLSWLDSQSGLGAEVSSENIIGSLSGYTYPIDFTGDGLTDLVYPSGTTWWYKRANAAGFELGVNTGISHNDGYSGAIPIDYDIDGRIDLLINAYNVIRWNGSSFVIVATSGVDTGANFVSDFNGDGRQDLIRVNGASLYVQLNSGSGFSSPVLVYSAPSGDGFGPLNFQGPRDRWDLSDLQFADFNGDGRGDLVIPLLIWHDINNDPMNPIEYLITQVLLSNGTYYEEAFPTVPDYRNYFGGPRVLDINGDGLSDLTYLGSDQSPGLNVRFGTGTGIGPQIQLGINAGNQLPLDWNNDGKQDLLWAGSTSTHWQLLVSNGNGFDPNVSTTVPVVSREAARLGDVNGDGLLDLMYPDASNVWKYRLHNGIAGDLVAAIQDGFGNTISLTYAALTDPNTYTKGSGASYPAVDVQAAIQVVKQYSASDGVGGTYTVSHTYSSARVNVQGRGLLGFAQRSATDSRTNIRNTWNYRQDFPYIGMVSASSAIQSNGAGQTITSTTNTYSDLVTNATAYNDRHYPYVSASTQANMEVAGSYNGQGISQVATSMTVDSYGNPTNSTVTTSDLTGSGQTFTTQTANTITNDTANWCLGFVTTQAVTNSTSILSGQTRTTNLVSDSANPTMCRVKQQIIEPSIGASTVTTTFDFNAFGHPTTQTVSATGIANRVTTTSYGSKGVFPVSITNAENETATKTYDYALGVPLTATDPNGIAVSWQYDGFGRKTRENRPDSTATTWGLAACNVGNGYCGNSLLRYQVTEQQLNSSGATIRTAIQAFDAQGRIKYDQSQTLSGAYSVVATNYDNQGRVSQKSQPYFAGFPAYYTTFTYDLVGRPTQEQRQISETNTGSQTTQYAYNRLVHTQTDANNNVTTKTMNAIGQVVQMIDPASGNTYYTYDQFGNLLTTKDPLNNTITNTFNIRGFKLTTSDPNMGNWSYTYFRTGELNTQTDAKAQTVTFTYDKVSRPKTRDEPEGTTTWTYGTSAASKNFGKLATVTSPGGYAEAYFFDSLGRPSQVNTTADTTTFSVNNAYSSATGQLESVTYPNSTSAVANSRVKIQYDYAYGLLQAVKDAYNPATVYWQQVATNPAGQAIDEQYGNGLHTLSDYDYLTGQLDTRTTGTTAQVQNLAYQWDRVGNLTQRRDLIQNLTEDFAYDTLYRLDTSTLNGVQNLNVDYNAAGNITVKSDVGSYSYPTQGAGSVRPHAVTGAGSNTLTYDANGNMSAKNGSALTWFSYNLPNRINKGGSYAQFSYGAGRGRYKQVAVTAAGGPLPAGTETTIYIGGLFERVTKPSGVIEYKHYVLAGNEAIAVRTLRSNSANDVRYLHKDHLGSVDTITNESGTVVQRLSYDAFGKRRNAQTWSGGPTSTDWTSIAALTHRGFTFHEQLDNVDMVHMNGRVYDPNIGRFISADPFIQAPLMSQSLNRYSYVMNNPLSLIDPSGYSWLSDLFKRVWNFVRSSVNVIIAAVLYAVGAIMGGPAGVALANAAVAVLFSPLQVRKDKGGYSVSWGFNFSGGVDRGPFDRGSTTSGSPTGATPSFNPVVAFGPGAPETIRWIPPSLPQWLVNEFAGLGDALTFGLTRAARESTGLGAASVDTTSSQYQAAYWTTTAAQLFASGGTAALIARAGQVVRVTTGVGSASAQNIANGPRLVQQLRGEQISSQFTAAGTLTPEAIANSQLIVQAGRIGNSAIPAGFAKYTTAPLPAPFGGSVTTRFYMNATTKEVFYGLDYKTLLLP